MKKRNFQLFTKSRESRDSKKMDDKIKIKSLYKAMRVLECFNEKQPLSITEISEKLGMYKSNVFDILSTLSALNYVIKNEESNKYSLGSGLVRLGRAAATTNSLQNIATPIIKRISKMTGETVYLTIPSGYQIFYLNAVFPGAMDEIESIGTLLNTAEPMHLTSNGKAMLSHMSEAFIDDYCSMPLASATEFSITSPDKLREELALIRERGYAVDEQENTIGMRCVGVAICNNSGNVAGGLSICGKISGVTKDKVVGYSNLLKEAAEEIRKHL